MSLITARRQVSGLPSRHPERITAIISQNGNAYEEGLSDGWTPIRAYWEDPSPANRKALRAFLTPETTRWQYTHGVPDPTIVSPDGQNLDNFYLARPGADEIQLDLFGRSIEYPLFELGMCICCLIVYLKPDASGAWK